MTDSTWFDTVNVAMTVCDREGVVVTMNDKAAATFANWGGKELIGQSLMNCHKPSSQVTIRDLMEQNKPNTYSIEKNGVKKIIVQTPWYQDGEVAGLVEFSFEVPFEMPHHIRG